MRQIRTSGLMSGEGKRSHWPSLNATAPFLDSTTPPSRRPAPLARGFPTARRERRDFKQHSPAPRRRKRARGGKVNDQLEQKENMVRAVSSRNGENRIDWRGG